MTSSSTFEQLRADIAEIPVIDCHEHTSGPSHAQKYKDPLTALIQGYVQSDLASASNDAEMAVILDEDKSLEERWAVFEKVWKRTEHTGYARVTKWILREFYGEKTLTLAALRRMAQKPLGIKNEQEYWSVLDKAGIRCRIVNVWPADRKVIDGTHTFPDRDRYMIPLPIYHSFGSANEVSNVTRIIDRNATSLEEYVAICRTIFTRLKERGAIGMKDQSAYGRTLRFDNAPRAEAERLFDFIMEDPRRSIGWPERKPLDDWLFHAFMRIARDLDLPVQIHTGHMAGVRNDIAKTNAVHFTSVLELHRDVRFDLFHGNWPYAGEWLYLGKNYPNVALDCCWLNIIDPVYARNVLYEAVTAVPHGKIMGFGGDYGDSVDYAAGHLAVARDNIAAALARHIDEGWLGADEARQVAADWLFNNPNRFFRLGFEEVSA